MPIKNIDWIKIEKMRDDGKDGLGGSTVKTLLMDTDPESDLGKRLQLAFPEFYTENAISAGLPIRWTAIVAECNRMAKQSNGGGIFPNELNSSGLLHKYQIPVRCFSTTKRNHEEWKTPLLNPTFAAQCCFGAVVSYNGHEYVVVQREHDEVTLSLLKYFIMPKRRKSVRK